MLPWHHFRALLLCGFAALTAATPSLAIEPASADADADAQAQAQAARVPPLGLPIDCTLGTDCFVQQWPDMDKGPSATDPFCGSATYDGHDGVDIRIESMKDVATGVPVVASADGRIRGVRDGMADHLVRDEKDRAAIKDRECGNGVAIVHGDGVETQYCHMRKGSVVVKAGETVKAGQKLGEVGASGLAQFPHVHLSVRVDGRKFDSVSGRPLDGPAGCAGTDAFAHTFFTSAAAAELPRESTAILDLGMAGAPVEYKTLVTEGAPEVPKAGAPLTLLWGWFINLRKGDVIEGTIVGPDGATFFDNKSEPVAHNQASYSQFGGRRRVLTKGTWTVSFKILRNGAPVAERRRTIEVE